MIFHYNKTSYVVFYLSLFIFITAIYGQKDSTSTYSPNLHNSVGIGFFMTRSPEYAITNVGTEKTAIIYSGSAEILPSLYISSEFLVGSSFLIDLNVSYQNLPLGTSHKKSEKNYLQNHLRTRTFIGYGFFKRDTSTYFKPKSISDIKKSYGVLYTTVTTTYKGYKIPYNRIMGLVIGAGAMYIRSSFEQPPEISSLLSNKKFTYDHITPFIELKYFRHSLDAKRPVYGDFFARFFSINEEIGWDVGGEVHGLLHMWGWYYWHGHQFGLRSFSEFSGFRKRTFDLYYRFIWSFNF